MTESEQLTEQWKKGELLVGEYYLLYKDGTTDREYYDWVNVYGRVAEKGFSTYPNDIVKVLAPVPTYDEVCAIKRLIADSITYGDRLKAMQEENAQFKELLHENRQKMFEAEKNYGFDDSIIDILAPQMDKIDKLLGDKTDE